MQSNAATPDEYIASLPDDRREAMAALRKAINKNLPKGFKEEMGYGMMGWVVPHSKYPAGYHCDPKQPMPYACLGSQKNYIALHVMTVYGDNDTEQWLRKAWTATGKRLDMGKCCIRFRKLEDIPLEVIGKLIARVPVKSYIARIEEMLGTTSRKTKKKK